MSPLQMLQTLGSRDVMIFTGKMFVAELKPIHFSKDLREVLFSFICNSVHLIIRNDGIVYWEMHFQPLIVPTLEGFDCQRAWWDKISERWLIGLTRNASNTIGEVPEMSQYIELSLI